MLAPPLPLTAAAQQAGQLALRDVWRASELAVSRSSTCGTGHAALNAELPNGGWPRSVLIELLLQQAGIGELQLLKPVLSQLSATQRIALIQPPYLPHAMACRAWGLNEAHLLWLRSSSSADALWAAEQILKNGSCGAVVLWQANVRPEALRRLNLAAQSTDTWLWLMRPLAAAADASPSPLRIALRPAHGGISADIIKRKGPHCDTPLFIPLAGMPAGPSHAPLEDHHETAAQRLPAPAAARSAAPVLV
ncbi:translesion DNA synthesis-associated protein ImuA [Oxalobacteraceae bacterium]|nr:translesion DNA synthesis-associated protein ImuA [Oxalobacteraceae bacterium]